MKKLLVTLLVLIPLISSAETINSTHELTDVQIAELNAAIAQMQIDKLNVENTSSDMISIVKGLNISEEEMSNLGTYGSQLGKVVTGFVKEIGMSINEFLHTPFGLIAFLMLIWHLFASDISLIIMSFFILYIFYKFWKMMVAPALYTENDENDENKYIDLDSTASVLGLVAFIIMIIIEIVIMSNIG